MCSPPQLLLLLGFAIGTFGSGQKLLAENAKLSNDSLLWGPYRPNLYFGVRPRIPKSFSGNLLWSHVGDFQAVQNSSVLVRPRLAIPLTDTWQRLPVHL